MAKVTKVTKIILASSLILSLSSMAAAAEHNRRDGKREVRPQAQNYDINGLKVILGAGVGTGIGAKSSSDGVTFSTSGASLNAKLKLGTGIFTTTKNSTLGLQATIGVGANNLTSALTPQYSVNLDFIQAFKLGQSGYVKLGYVVGVGAAIRTNDNVNAG
ncbi:hypothetical protein, partial [Helicobacter sp. 13S00401-1]|uniref:hypothetical protein n=1 Tax=Helicobacter sp. 13S00401-1 TaxID=1905758 RepID=UPI001179CF3F